MRNPLARLANSALRIVRGAHGARPDQLVNVMGDKKAKPAKPGSKTTKK